MEYGERKRESKEEREKREGGRRKATQRSNFCADLVRILVPHVLYFFTQFTFFFIFDIISCYVMWKYNFNKLLSHADYWMSCSCSSLISLHFLGRFYYMLHIFFLYHTLLKSHLCSFSLITIELTSCYMCAITYDYCP